MDGRGVENFEPVNLSNCLNDFDEIQSLPKDLCVLTRTNQRLKAIGEKLHKEGIPTNS